MREAVAVLARPCPQVHAQGRIAPNNRQPPASRQPSKRALDQQVTAAIERQPLKVDSRRQ